jgi:SAM-dependent methyltransferase
MRIEAPWERLEDGRFWRAVDAEHNRLIAEQLGDCHEVLDLGCGYGSLTAFLTAAGFDTRGVDSDTQSIDRAKLLFPSLDDGDLADMDACSLDFPDDRFDAVVLRDTLHHLWEEGDVDTAFDEIERVLRPEGRLVVFDPNPNLVLQTCRWIARHRDARCTFPEARGLLTRRGWTIRRAFYSECFALAVSGGYVGIEFTPRWSSLHAVLLAANRAASRLLSKVGLGPALLWRYCVLAESPKRVR